MYLYNSATHKKEELKTHTPNHVEMYTCGPTVYHFDHIGNLRSYIMEDVLEKYLRFAGYSVNRVMNITDVGHLTSDADEAVKIHAVMHGVFAVFGQHQVWVHIAQSFRHSQPPGNGLPRRNCAKRCFILRTAGVKKSMRWLFRQTNQSSH